MVFYEFEDVISGKNTIKVLSDDIGVLVLPVYLCQDKALQCKLQMQSWDSTALDFNAKGVELSINGVQLPDMQFLNGCNTTSCPYWKDSISALNIPSIRIFVGLHEALHDVAASQAELMEFRNLIFTALVGQPPCTSMAKVQVTYQKPNRNNDPAQKLFTITLSTPIYTSCSGK